MVTGTTSPLQRWWDMPRGSNAAGLFTWVDHVHLHRAGNVSDTNNRVYRLDGEQHVAEHKSAVENQGNSGSQIGIAYICVGN